MDWLIAVDWESVFTPQTSLLEILIRGTIMYLALYTLLRVVLRRQRGGMGVTDLLVIVLIADAAQNAMAGEYKSIPDGVLLVAVIIGWAATLDWLGYRFPLVQRFVHPQPLTLFEDGRMVEKNMARQSVTEDELMEQVRLQGLTDLQQTERVVLEGNGQMSVMRKDTQQSGRRRQIY